MQDIANDFLQEGYSKLLRVSTVQYTTNATNNLPKNLYFNFLYMFYGVTMIFLQNIKLTLPEFSVKENFSLKCRKKEKNPKKEQSIPEIFRKSYYQNILNRIRLKR